MVRLAEDEIRQRARRLSGWEVVGSTIRKRYAFDSFKSAMAFVNRVAELAEAADHHPDLLVEYKQVTLTLTTHDSGGLTARDFRLAEAIDS